MANQGYSTFSGDVATYIAQKTLMIAKKQVVFQQLGEKAVLPYNNSKVFQYTRYERLNLPSSSLTEGTTPDNTSMSISTVTATMDQWGAYINLSDVADMTIKHPVVAKGIDLMGYQAAETVDREIIKVLLTGTSVSFPAAVTLRSSLANTDVMSSAVVRKVVKNLRSRGAHEYDGQDYVAVVDPSVEADLMADASFVNAASYSNIKTLFNGEIGKWLGARFMRSNLIPAIAAFAHTVPTTPASPAGTFTAADYRVSVAYYSASTGFLVGVGANTAVTFASLDSMAITLPASTAYVYKIFIGLAAGAATAVMYQGVESTLGTGFIPAATAAVVLAPPIAGDSILGSDIPASGVTVHFSWFFGKEAYTVVELQKLQTYVTPKAASDSDPLAQRRKAGWKLMFKSVINNDNFMERTESGSAY
jgi:N4-gp56 family major capsid protein